MNSRVTVLIPNYNGEKFLPFLFESLISQTYQAFDCIFLDDGSSDNSISIANAYREKIPTLKVFELPNVGISGNWNRGIELVKTEFFTLLHCDDAYGPEYLAELVKLMDLFTEAAIGHCAAITIDERSIETKSAIEKYKARKYFPQGNFCRPAFDEYNLLLSGNYITCPSVMYRTEAIRKIGPFNSELKQALDWEYWFRVLSKGYRICGTHQRLYLYRRHSLNTSRVNGIDRFEEELMVLKNSHRTGCLEKLCDSSLDTSIIRNIVIYDFAETLLTDSKSTAKERILYLVRHDLITPGQRTFLYGVALLPGSVGGRVLIWLIYGYVHLLKKTQS